MAYKKKDEIEYTILEFYGNIRGKEDNWGIGVAKMQWGNDTPTVNIRNMNQSKGVMGKGVAITDLETDLLVDVLLDAGYGTVDAIERALEKKRTLFDYSDELIQEMMNDN